jgi:hypothetical protein
MHNFAHIGGHGSVGLLVILVVVFLFVAVTRS